VTATDARILRCIDADTLVVSVAFTDPLLNITGEVVRHLRLFGVNAPELKTPEGKAAKAFVTEAVGKATRVTVEPVKASDDFGRLLAHVFLDGDSLARQLLEAGFAVPFRGVAKPED
jgi:micrococcal nuclease